MKKLSMFFIAALALMATNARADVITVFQSAAAATATGAVFASGGYGSTMVQIYGITSATVTFKASVDGTNYVSVLATNITTGAIAATATANGIYFVPCAAYTDIECPITTYSSGTITVTGRASNLGSGYTQGVDVSGGTSTYCFAGGTGNAQLTNTAVQVGSSAAHSLYGVDFINLGATAVYVQVFDLPSGSVILGTTVPKIVKWIPAGGAWEEKWAGEGRILFANAITFAATATPTGAGVPSATLLGNVEYQ
jgi:hypothetical protein